MNLEDIFEENIKVQIEVFKHYEKNLLEEIPSI